MVYKGERFSKLVFNKGFDNDDVKNTAEPVKNKNSSRVEQKLKRDAKGQCLFQ